MSSLVNQAAVIGDGKKFPSVLISPNLRELEALAKKSGVSTSDTGAMVRDPKVRAAYKEMVDKVNGTLAHHESLKKFAVVPDEWNVESGELTPSMKLKRRVIVEKYKEQIDAFYRESPGESKGE